MRKIQILILLLFSAFYSSGQNITGYEYWIDSDFTAKSTTTVNPAASLNLNLAVPVTGLQTGIHALNFRAWDSNKKYSSTLSHYFYKAPVSTTSSRSMTAYEYWTDNDYAAALRVNAAPQQHISIDRLIQANTMKYGIHAFNIRFMDSGKVWSSTLSHYFYKAPVSTTSSRSMIAYEYWTDNDYAAAVKVNAAPQPFINIDQLIQTSTLNLGVHAFHIRFMDSGKVWSSTLSHYFYKAPKSGVINREITAAEYWMNNDYAAAVRINNLPQSQLLMDKLMDVKNLPNGLHTFNIHFRDNTGLWSSTLSQHYYKMHKLQQVTNFVSGYRYWFDNDFSTVVNVTVNPVTEQLLLDKVLDISQVLGGKHTINFQFRDALGLWSSATTDSITTTDVIKINLEVEINGNVIKSKQDNATYRWLDCDNNYAPLEGGTQQSYTALKSGNYAAEISYLSRKDTTDCYQVTYSGVESNRFTLNAHIWPNPTTGSVQINLGESYREIGLSVVDISGKMIRNLHFQHLRTINLDFSGEASGVYFVTITADGRNGKLKLLKK